MKEIKFPREQLVKLIEEKYILPINIDTALKTTGISPTPHRWRNFVDNLMLWLGSLALSFSMLFFIAYNWNKIGRFAQFALVEIAIVLAVGVYYKINKEHIGSKVSLIIASILLGVLLALFGQTYQTGADTWQLFFYWAVLILPWVIIGRFPALWILWVALLNLSLILYHQVFQSIVWSIFNSESTLLWYLFGFNIAVQIIWEITLRYKESYASEHWSIRILTVASGIPITWLVLINIVEIHATSILPTLVWILYLTTLYIFYKKIKPDLFILAGGCLSVIIVIMTFLSMHILKDLDAGGFFVLALCVIGLGTASAFWLKNLHQEWQS